LIQQVTIYIQVTIAANAEDNCNRITIA